MISEKVSRMHMHRKEGDCSPEGVQCIFVSDCCDGLDCINYTCKDVPKVEAKVIESSVTTDQFVHSRRTIGKKKKEWIYSHGKVQVKDILTNN